MMPSSSGTIPAVPLPLFTLASFAAGGTRFLSWSRLKRTELSFRDAHVGAGRSVELAGGGGSTAGAGARARLGPLTNQAV
jgi:hypothetical protein